MRAASLLVVLLTLGVAWGGVSHPAGHRAKPAYKKGGTITWDEIVGNLNNRAARTATAKVLNPGHLYPQYNITYSATNGQGKTIAIVDAYGASTAETDLGYFSTAFGLPACTTANGCFKKVNQTGGTLYPPDDTQPQNDGNWGYEVALDLQTVHAIAPGAKILLVVSNSNYNTDMFPAIAYAKAHADYVSMSFMFSEDSSWTASYDSTYIASAPHVPLYAATGDSGEAANYPATSPSVVAVGGTTIYTNSDYSFSSEQGWSESGGGCSTIFTAPSVQSTHAGYSALGCAGKRAVPDVAMDADPNSGLTISYSGVTSTCFPPNCFYYYGGTSLATPLFAARAAIRGVAANVTYVYGNHIAYRDITVGNNGHPCTAGLDLVTGQGTWANLPFP